MQHRGDVLILIVLACGVYLSELKLHAQQEMSPPNLIQPDNLPGGVDQDQQAMQIQQWIRDLGAGQFALRERAATALVQSGPSGLAALQQALPVAEDPEVRDRVAGLVQRMGDAQRQSRVDRFLAGEDVGFIGWPEFCETMGDSKTVRELFVEVDAEHPVVVKALAGTAKEVTSAMNQIATKIQNRMFVQRRQLSRADTTAMMMPMCHRGASVTAGYEAIIITTLDRVAASEIRRDVRLEPGFQRLIANWISRCTLENRAESLSKAMQWDVQQSLPKAIATLTETQDIPTLIVAMQTIARFGSQDDAVALRPVLRDSRLTGEAAYGGDRMLQSEVRDVAIATVAILHKIPLADVGFARASTHPTYGFVPTGIVYGEADAAELRAQNDRRIQKLLDAVQAPGS